MRGSLIDYLIDCFGGLIDLLLLPEMYLNACDYYGNNFVNKPVSKQQHGHVCNCSL